MSEKSHAQVERFLALLQAMDSESQRSFRKIYEMAPRENKSYLAALSGPHVRFAMMEALKHPSIAYWVRLNLAVRVARKLMGTAGLQERVRCFSALLEDFHIAADAYVQKIPVDFARQARLEKAALKPELSFPESLDNDISDEELALIQEFKARIIPGFVQAIRQKHLKPVSQPFPE